MKSRKTYDKIKIRLAACVVCLGAFLAGCGAEGAESYTRRGMTEVQALNYDEALSLFSAGEENGEDKRLLYRGMGIAYMGKTDYESAIAYLEAALKLSDGNVEDMDFDINYYLATAYFKNGQAQEAVQAYDAILALRPKEMDAYYLRGCVELSQNEFEKAQADFDVAHLREVSLLVIDLAHVLQKGMSLANGAYGLRVVGGDTEHAYPVVPGKGAL